MNSHPDYANSFGPNSSDNRGRFIQIGIGKVLWPMFGNRSSANRKLNIFGHNKVA